MTSHFIIIIILLVAVSVVAGQNSIVFGKESIKLSAEFIEQDNIFLEDDNDFQASRSNFTTNDSNLCPSNSCTYSLNLQLHPDIVGGQYAIDGELNVNNTAENTVEYQQFDIRIELVGNGTLDDNQTQNISGNIGIGGNVLFSPAL